MGILTSLFLLLLIGATTPSNGQGGADFNFLKDGLVLREQSIINAFENGLHLQRKLITEVEICNAVQGIMDPSASVCCSASCGICGGDGCQYRNGGASSCCVGTIQDSWQHCGTPPCVIDIIEYESGHLTCADVGGIPGPDNVCCASSCLSCGGEGCNYLNGGASNCCRGDIIAEARVCGGGINAPCVLPATTGGTATPSPTTAPIITPLEVCNAIGGIISGTSACCPISCGSCDGEGCDTRTGGASHCCAGTIEASGTKCGQPPCIPDPEFYNAPSPTSAPVDPYTMCSSRGGIISADHTVCCSQSCGTCGGVGCDSRDGGAVNCCQGTIESLNHMCGDPPCILPDMSTPPPTTSPPSPPLTSIGICTDSGGILDGGITCCSPSCGTCGGEGCGERPGGSSSCCSSTIHAAGTICGSPPYLADPAQYVMGPDPTCSTGVAGTHGNPYDPNPETYCKKECGSCGGFGCRGFWEEGGGASQCCSGAVAGQQRLCTEFGPPCVMVHDTGNDVPMDYPFDTLTPQGIALFSDVQIFYAPYKGLTGGIPPEIGTLIHTLSLDLKFNNLQGYLPTELGTLQNLIEYLNLGQNSLTGSIPESLGNLHQIHTIDISYNSLTGSIPASFLQITNLFRLKLIGNNLSGPITWGLSQLTNLKDIQLYGNKLSGHIPEDLGYKSSMFEFDISDNELTGPIPQSFGNLVGLKGLLLNDNQLSGWIPAELGNLGPYMKTLFLHNNQLEAALRSIDSNEQIKAAVSAYRSIPPELGNIQAMMFFHAYNNKLTGPIPPQLQNAYNLFALMLQNNMLSGIIPPEIGNLQKLGVLNLNNNLLTGTIPPELGQCSQLMYLRLANNHLEGNIPPELKTLYNLKKLDLSGNPNLNNAPSYEIDGWEEVQAFLQSL